MSFFRHIADFAEESLGGSALFGVVGGFGGIPGASPAFKRLERGVGQAVSLATVLDLAGPAFRKPAAQLLASGQPPIGPSQTVRPRPMLIPSPNRFPARPMPIPPPSRRTPARYRAFV